MDERATSLSFRILCTSMRMTRRWNSLNGRRFMKRSRWFFHISGGGEWRRTRHALGRGKYRNLLQLSLRLTAPHMATTRRMITSICHLSISERTANTRFLFFKHLGSCVHRDCNDEFEIDSRLKAAGSAFGALSKPISVRKACR